ncbi:uncharacterized protein CC84DRAFT_122988 [Paraphaeosphaeria sporulosa]|uniref:Uncharacterized protein n=1 Tax=Paraphaeosphaeria sporulosa TaxID=1460663 RepID=A0A177CXX6_9PLEO|nr:uncharacterized protein CC84DRAFT_122988 [Paraphaeosphaeria sporulosa]OAG12424.1 hypothetical protein CC84DRAFT_122988 [Paraphaeosphaeria sporulosa]
MFVNTILVGFEALVPFVPLGPVPWLTDMPNDGWVSVFPISTQKVPLLGLPEPIKEADLGYKYVYVADDLSYGTACGSLNQGLKLINRMLIRHTIGRFRRTYHRDSSPWVLLRRSKICKHLMSLKSCQSLSLTIFLLHAYLFDIRIMFGVCK